MKPLLFLLSCLLLGAMNSCYYDNETDLYPDFAQCDTTNVTYSQSIAPIMSASCNSCHNTATASGGIITDTYAGVQSAAAGGLLWKAVNHESGVLPMPQGGGKLSSCNLQMISIWINAGMPNN